MYSVIVAFCNVFAFFNVGLPCTLYFVLWLSIKVFVLKKKKKKKKNSSGYPFILAGHRIPDNLGKIVQINLRDVILLIA